MIKELINTPINQDWLVEYLRMVDMDFGVAISSKTSLEEYAAKLLHHGKVLTYMWNNEIVGLVGCYCNDKLNKVAYISILSTLVNARGKGVAKLLIHSVIAMCRDYGMKLIKVNSINPIAIAVYQKMGFSIVREDMCEELKTSYLEFEIKV